VCEIGRVGEKRREREKEGEEKKKESRDARGNDRRRNANSDLTEENDGVVWMPDQVSTLLGTAAT
jgi:hypothetical protein